MRLRGSWRLRDGNQRGNDLLGAGCFAEAVAQGEAYSVFGGERAEDDVDSDFVEGSHSGEEAAGQDIFVVPFAPEERVGVVRGVPAIGEHEAEVVGREIQRADGISEGLSGVGAGGDVDEDQAGSGSVVTEADPRGWEAFGMGCGAGRRGGVLIDSDLACNGRDHFCSDGSWTIDGHASDVQNGRFDTN
jgi:hypothetical protein